MSNLLKSKTLKLALGLTLAVFMFVGFAGVASKAVSTKVASAQTVTYDFGTTTVKSGSKGTIAGNWQAFFNNYAGASLVVDGVFGAKSVAAAKAWQASKGLVADGLLGGKSRAAAVAQIAGGSSSLPAGCTSTSGYSSTTGASCATGAGSSLPAGCTSTAGFSVTTGMSCSGTGTVVTGSANIALSASNPAAGSVPATANANFTKFTLASGATATSITSMYVTRYGLSTNSDVENIKILDENMIQVSSSGSLNSNNKAQVSFSPALVIPAGTVKSFYIRAGITSGSTSASVALGIDSASDIVSNSTFGGTFPVKGNEMSIVTLTIGTLTADEDGTVSDSQPNGGDTDVVVNKFKLTAGSSEGVTVQQISLERQGTAAASDIANIELFDVTKNQTVGTVASWDANGRAAFNNLAIVLEKGETRRFEVRLDIIGGSSLTVNADLTDGSDVTVQAFGNTYGFFITPTNSMTNGQGASNQTIQSGTMTVTKSSSTPATGNISYGSDVNLGVFDVRVMGETMKVTSFEVNSTLGTMVYTEVTNIKLVNADTGALLAGPKDMASDGSAVFTDVMFFPVGVTKVKVTANIASTVSASDTIKVDIDDASTEIVARGETSRDSVTPSPASIVSSNILTVQAATLTAVTNTTPAARSIVKGQQDFVFATVTLSAANSGEDVIVTALVVESTADVAANDANSGSEDIDNVEIWADLTSGVSARGDAYETLVSTTKQFAGTNDGDATLSFTLAPYLTVARNSSVGIAVVADLSASAVATDTFAVSLDTDSGDVTANGKGGSSVTVTPTGAGQAMVVSAGGTLTLTVDTTSPQTAGLLLDVATEQTVAVFRLAADNTESLVVDSIKITDDGTNGNDVVASYVFYNGSTLLGTVVPDGSGNAELFLTSGGLSCVTAANQLCIPANSHKLVTVKAVLNDIDGSGFVNTDTIIVTVNAAGDVDTTGLASGTAVDSTQTSVDAVTFTAYEAYPVVAFVTDSSIGTLVTQSANQYVAKISMTNNGDKDVTFQSGDSNLFSVQVNIVATDDTNTGNETMTLKDENGTVLDTATYNIASTQLDFNMSSVGATVGTTIPAGQTKYFYLYADTSDLEDAGNSIQVWLDDTAADVTFGINGTGAYAEADYILKGDLFGPVLSRVI